MNDHDVRNFYNEHWKRFDVSRVRIWHCVRQFIESLPKGSHVLDAGCGNGKNMIYMEKNGMKTKGIDFSEKLVNVCSQKDLKTCVADIRKIPYPDDYFDHVICIAVLHHLQKEEDRVKAMNEMLRVCKKGGKVMVCIWAVESSKEKLEKRKFVYGDNLVKWEDTFRYYFVYDKEHIEKFTKQFNTIDLNWERGNWYYVVKKV